MLAVTSRLLCISDVSATADEYESLIHLGCSCMQAVTSRLLCISHVSATADLSVISN